MSKNTTLNLRIDSEIKEKSGKILQSMGLTFSEAFNLLLHQVCIQQALPFDVISYNHKPRKEILDFIDRVEQGKEEIVGPFSSEEELWRSLGI